MRLEPLCRCNNCMNIFVDHNPTSDAPIFKVSDKHRDLVKIDNEWVCPVCRTDQFLSDITLSANINYYVGFQTESEWANVVSSLLTWCNKGMKDARKTNSPRDLKYFIHFKETILKHISEHS